MADCSVCSKNYVPSLTYTYRRCSHHTMGIVIAAVLLVPALVVGFFIDSYLVSAGTTGVARGVIDGLMERIPLQSVKIMICVADRNLNSKLYW